MLKTSTRFKVNLGFAFALAVLLGISLASQQSAHRLAEASAADRRTQETLDRLDEVFALSLAEQSAYRRFVLAGNEEALGPYNRSARLVLGRLAELRSAEDRADHERLLDALEATIRQRHREVGRAIGARRGGGATSAARMIDSGAPALLSDQIAAQVQALKAEERRAFGARSGEVERSARRTTFIVALGGGLALLVVVLVTYLVSVDLTRRQREAKRLQESEARYRTLIEQIPAIIYVSGINEIGRIIYATQQTEALLGFSEADLREDPQRWFKQIHPEDRERVRSQWYLSHAGGHRFALEYRVLSREQRTLWVRDEAVVVRNERGEPLFIQGAMFDITDRKAAEDMLERLQRQNELILDSAGEGIYGLDLQGRATFINPAAARMLGWKVPEVIGRSMHQLVRHASSDGTPYPKEECPICAAVRAGVVRHEMHEVYYRKDGSSIPIEYISTPIREEGRLVGAVVTFSDISERREIERMKNEFISVVSHELKTPLTSIRGALGLLASGLITTQPEKAQRMLELAVTNTDRLVRLINDILDIERIESGRIAMEKKVCDIGDLMTHATEVMRPMADKAGVTLLVEPLEANLWADPDRIIQTLTNLLSNAIKFSPVGGQVLLGAARRGDQVVLWTRDEGRGIPEDKLEAVFGRFQQVDASDSREKGGTGLGLAICRNIVQMHDGRIWVESAVGRGSTFYVSLPMMEERTWEQPAGMENPND